MSNFNINDLQFQCQYHLGTSFYRVIGSVLQKRTNNIHLWNSNAGVSIWKSGAPRPLFLQHVQSQKDGFQFVSPRIPTHLQPCLLHCLSRVLSGELRLFIDGFIDCPSHNHLDAFVESTRAARPQMNDFEVSKALQRKRRNRGSRRHAQQWSS